MNEIILLTNHPLHLYNCIDSFLDPFSPPNQHVKFKLKYRPLMNSVQVTMQPYHCQQLEVALGLSKHRCTLCSATSAGTSLERSEGERNIQEW